MSDAMFAVQDAVYTILTASSGVQAVLGSPARIYDHVPPDASFPFLTLGAVQAEGFDTKDRTGTRQTLVLHAWSRARGSEEVKNILSALYDVLHLGSFTVAGHELAVCQWRQAETMLDDDGLTRHGVAQYEVITQKI
ncbi:MAG: DUF3168 domain-containing protein [Alphaproteobacteria bacterium]